MRATGLPTVRTSVTTPPDVSTWGGSSSEQVWTYLKWWPPDATSSWAGALGPMADAWGWCGGGDRMTDTNDWKNYLPTHTSQISFEIYPIKFVSIHSKLCFKRIDASKMPIGWTGWVYTIDQFCFDYILDLEFKTVTELPWVTKELFKCPLLIIME